MKFHARVFRMNGNSFLIPGYWYPDDDEDWDGMSPSSVVVEGMLLGVICGFDNHQEWKEVDAKDDGTAALFHFRRRLVGRQFAHGAIDILLISGPEFDREINAPYYGS